ncbi:IS200/IS605 family transposase [Bythopirellula polymerisocia]|uniref:Transposase IS200 like protein n=1 Tax=Bythopirellula polymerisocia TaxID=2528003 RepID=A0A5C6CPT7_9BACT|nr:IS200/IS605 family transposase [Bythopirellula polymerisocia]TWU26055.1 Transposase IS200 like protein [Bythopirellula polymerisocia]
MKDWRSQSHVKWDCKYHVVIVPKYRRRKFYGSLRGEIGKILRDLCRQKDMDLVKGNALPDHVHLLLSAPPKYSIANTVGFSKGKSAIRINRDLEKVKGNLYGRAFWSRGYCVSTVGLDEAMIREYIQNQEKHERDQERGLFDID